MLKDDYNISITGQVTLSTTGTYTQRDGAQFIAYKEYDEDDPRQAHTAVLKVEPGKVTMIRQGSSTRLILEEGRRHLAMYETPYGELSIGVNTRRMRSTLGEAGGDLEIDYAIEIDNLVAGHNLFRMNVKKHPARTQRGRTEKRRADYAESDPGRP